MADNITSIPAFINATDTSAHEVAIPANLQLDGPVVLFIEVTTGSFKFSVGRTIQGDSATYNAASNKNLIVTLPPGRTLFYQATTAGDDFVISL